MDIVALVVDEKEVVELASELVVSVEVVALETA